MEGQTCHFRGDQRSKKVIVGLGGISPHSEYFINSDIFIDDKSQHD